MTKSYRTAGLDQLGPVRCRPRPMNTRYRMDGPRPPSISSAQSRSATLRKRKAPITLARVNLPELEP